MYTFWCNVRSLSISVLLLAGCAAPGVKSPSKADQVEEQVVDIHIRASDLGAFEFLVVYPADACAATRVEDGVGMKCFATLGQGSVSIKGFEAGVAAKESDRLVARIFFTRRSAAAAEILIKPGNVYDRQARPIANAVIEAVPKQLR